LAISQDDVPGIVGRVIRMRTEEQRRLHKVARYMHGQHDSVYTPHGAKTEYRWLRDRSVVNFLPLIVSVVAQNLHVDGYRPTPQSDVTDDLTAVFSKVTSAIDGGDMEAAKSSIALAQANHAKQQATQEDDQGPWQIMMANRVNSRQHGLHRSIAKYGLAYQLVLPGQFTDEYDDQPQSMPLVRAISPRRMTAMYEDDIDDEWPILAVEETVKYTADGKAQRIVYLYDDTNRYSLISGPNDDQFRWIDEGDLVVPSGVGPVMAHDLGICPVVRFFHEIDLDGELDVSGEVEPLIPIQDQINSTTFNTLMAGQYSAFRQRWATGMVPSDEDGNAKTPFRAGVDRLWVAESTDTKFGEFSQTGLADYIADREAAIRHMSTISQVPPYHLLGLVANLSAEALAAARDGLDRKIEELQGVLDDPWKQTIRLACKAKGDMKNWADTTGEVVWRDTSARAFAATTDALGKMSQMLGVPATELWSKIPGVSAEEVSRWKAAVAKPGVLEELDELLQLALSKGNQGAQLPGAPPTTAPVGQQGAQYEFDPGKSAKGL
jgi:hypothetical protein